MVRERKSSKSRVGGSRQTASTLAAPVRIWLSSNRVVLTGAVLLLAACTDHTGERVAGSAAVGGALGIPAGPIGVAVGAGVGAAAGALVPKTVLEGGSQETVQ
jgi:hypothetical protein